MWVWAAVGLIQLKPSMSLSCPLLWEQDGQEHCQGQSAVWWVILSLSFSKEAKGHSVLWASRQLQLLCSFWTQSVTAACELWLSGGGSEWWVIWVVGNGAAWMGSISNQSTILQLFKTVPHLLKEWTVARQNLCWHDWSRSCFHCFLSSRCCCSLGPTRVTLEEGVWKVHGTRCLGKLFQALREAWLG